MCSILKSRKKKLVGSVINLWEIIQKIIKYYELKNEKHQNHFIQLDMPHSAAFSSWAKTYLFMDFLTWHKIK